MRLFKFLYLRVLIIFIGLLICSPAYSQTTTIYQDDFEGAVSGWTDNSTDFAPLVTNFLGRFADGQTTTSRTFTVPANSDELVIEFDLYRFDSWDNQAAFGFDRFELEINGTEIFSLPFPNPQTARSGTTGNVDWSHSPLTGKEELGFNSGQYWFDQLHRFEVTVNNPSTSVTLTLRAALTQEKFDESAGYDNFRVTAGPTPNDITAVAESFSPVDGDSGGATPSVLSSDTINGSVLNPSDVTITSATSSSPNVTLDVSTGLITIAAGTSAGFYTVDYQICENININNCSSVVETVTVTTAGGSSFCPVGTTAIPGTYHVVSVTPINGTPTNPNGALGAPLAEGSQDNNSSVTGVTFFQSLIYDLTGDPDITVPEGTAIDVSFANHWNSNPTANISTSLDGNSYTSVGSSVGPWTNNTFRYDEYIVPAGGARFMEVGFGGGGGLRFDGVIYDTQCQEASAPPTSLSANKTVDLYDPQNLGLYAVPGNDVIYTISVENTGTGDVDSGSLILIDNMPDEVTFYNGDIDDGGPETDPVIFQGAGSGLTFDYTTDVAFSDAATAPTDFANCAYTPSSGYDPNATFICLNPKGTMAGGTNWSISFRSRIE